MGVDALDTETSHHYCSIWSVLLFIYCNTDVLKEEGRGRYLRFTESFLQSLLKFFSFKILN